MKEHETFDAWKARLNREHERTKRVLDEIRRKIKERKKRRDVTEARKQTKEADHAWPPLPRCGGRNEPHTQPGEPAGGMG